MDPKDYRVDAAVETVRQIYRCSHCRELILSDYVAVDKRSFHVQCFKCKMCNASLIQGYFPLYPDFLCQECYTKISTSDCRSCKKPFDDEKNVVTAENARYHAACFVCRQCKKPLAKDGHYYSMDSAPYCLAHYCAKKYAAAGKKWPLTATAAESAEKSSSSSTSSSAGSPPKVKS